MSKYTFTGATTDIIHIQTLEFVAKGHTFYVDITLNTLEDCYYAWLWERSYGIKDMMFGCPVHNHRFGKPYVETLEGFTEAVIVNLPEYADGYMDDRLEEDGYGE